MRNNNRLVNLSNFITVISGKGINFSLIKSKLAYISLQVEDVRALHARIKNLRSWHIVTLTSTHNLPALFNSCDIVLARDINNDGPVFVRSFVDFIRCPQELDVGKIHTCCLPHFNEISPNNSDLVQVSIHFVVEQGEPICDPEDKDAASLCYFVDVDRFHDTLGDMHPSTGLKPIITSKHLLLLQQSF